YIRHTRYFELRGLHPGKPEAFPDNGMLYILYGFDPFHLRVLDDQFVDKCPVKGNVDIFVNSGRYQESTMVPVIRGEVGASAAKRDSERTARDNHRPDSL